MCDRAYPPQQQKHAMNSIRDNKTNEDFAVQEVVPVVMETVQNEEQQHGLEWVGILQARDGYTSLTITTSNIPYTPQHSIHHFQSYHILHTTSKPASPHLSLRHLIKSYHTLHPSSSNGYMPSTDPPTPNITSTLQYPYIHTNTPPIFSYTTTHHLHPIPIRPSNTLHPSNLYHTPQYPYTPSTPTHPQHLHTLQHSTHSPTFSYTTSPFNAPNTPSNTYSTPSTPSHTVSTLPHQGVEEWRGV